MDDWKLDFKHGMLLIWPQDGVRNMVNKLRSKYDPESQRTCEAHITLTQPFLEEPNDESWELIESVLRKAEPFDIHYGPIETFGDSPTLKFDIEPKDEILEIRNGLHDTGLFNLTLPFTEGFIPHMTISESGISTTEDARKVADELNSSINKEVFQCSSIVYTKPNDSFRFEVVKTLQLPRRV